MQLWRRAPDSLQKLVTKRMSKSIVHFLEAIEVEAKNAKPLAARQQSKIISDLLAEQPPIGQAGQATCMAIWAILASLRLRSVISLMAL